MPTYNSRGLPQYTDGESMPAWHTAYNAQSNLLATALDDADTADRAADSVATVAALPVTGGLRHCRQPRLWVRVGRPRR